MLGGGGSRTLRGGDARWSGPDGGRFRRARILIRSESMELTRKFSVGNT